MESTEPASQPKGHLSVEQGRSSAELGQWVSALIAFDNALNESDAWNADPDFLNDRAVALFHNERAHDAIGVLTDAIRLQPQYGYRFAARGWMRQALKDVNGAIADYEQAIALDPDDAITQNNLGLLEEQLGRMESAKQRFAAADQLDKVLSENDIKVQSSEQPKPTETVATPEPIATKKTPKSDPSAWTELTKAVTTSEGRREFIDFIRNGFKLNHRNDPH
jgi:tetratricopeptide (TPR) repeat protein